MNTHVCVFVAVFFSLYGLVLTNAQLDADLKNGPSMPIMPTLMV